MITGNLVPPTKARIARGMRRAGVDTSRASGFAEQQVVRGGTSSVHYWGVNKKGYGMQGDLDLKWGRRR